MTSAQREAIRRARDKANRALVEATRDLYEAETGETGHGIRGYWNGCRCNNCRDANQTYRRERRKINGDHLRASARAGRRRRRLLADWHGTLGGYTNHRCRCEACTEAMRVRQVDYRAKQARANRAPWVAK